MTKKDKLLNKRRKKRALRISGRAKSIDDYLRKKRYGLMERGGFAPEYFNVDYQVGLFKESLCSLADTNSDIFLDSNIISPVYCQRRIFTDYFELISYLEFPGFRETGNKLLQHFSEFVSFYEQLLRKENVFLTTGIIEESNVWVKNCLNKIKNYLTNKGTKTKFATPIKKMKELLEKEREKIADLGIEQDPIIGRIEAIFPAVLNTNSSYPSQADKQLIMVPFAAGLTDGRDKVVLSNDKALGAALTAIAYTLNKNPRALRLDDFLCNGFKEFKMSLIGMRDYLLERKLEYSIVQRTDDKRDCFTNSLPVF